MAKFKAAKSRKSATVDKDKSIPAIASCLFLVLAGIALIMWLFYGLLTSSK